MNLVKLTRKGRACAFLFLVFFSCSTPPKWLQEDIEARSKEQRAERYFYAPEDLTTRANVQILKGEYGTRFSLHLLSRPAKASPNEQDKVPVNVTVENDTQTYLAHLMKGGQVLLFNEKDGAWLLRLLKNGKSVQLSLSGYRITLPPIEPERHLEKSVSELWSL